jgi:L-alanine-DL-glutamate epimerase-like enolase superfamily enzyme
MRIWGPAPFQNSAAMDWLGGLASGLQLPDLAEALQHASSTNEAERATARAASALVAAALGNPENSLPETAKRWLARQDLTKAENLRHKAVVAARTLQDAELSTSLMRG